METSNYLFVSFFCILLASGYIGAQSSPLSKLPTKLFVFGDSYADTGNVRKSLGNSWKVPYGITFPGKPAGRFSNGRVFTDYLAKFLGISSPIPYQWMKLGRVKKLRNGVNFAYGGSGVFDTNSLNLVPNMTTQIDFFENLITNDSPYTKRDLRSSVVLVSLSGNDYSTFAARNSSIQGLQSFIPLVINQLATNLKRIHDLGVTKVLVSYLAPLGCLPRVTITSSYQQCNATSTLAVNFHNLLLQQAVAKLNNDTKSSTFFIIDLYKAFNDVLQQNGTSQGTLKFEGPLKPCCTGVSSAYACSSVDEKGVKMYTLCSNPKSAFFWDNSHPTQAGWRAVYTNLKSTLEQFF